jgi:HemY protein
MVAVAAGDVASARVQAKRAGGLLDELPLTMLLSAQAAQLDGDEAAARKYFAAMLERPETEFLGLRGLLLHAGREGDSDAALRLANRAYRLKPNAPWVLNALIDLQIRKGQWREAENVVRRAVKRKVIPRAQGRRHRAILFYQQSLRAEARAQPASALDLSAKAFRLAPGMVEVAARLAALQTRDGAPNDAMKTIEKAWGRAPHPELGRLYGEVYADEDALARLKRFEKLLKLRPDHLESHAALAEVALEAKLWGTARGHLEKAIGDISGGDAPARIFRQMAALEEAEHDDTEAAEAWLVRAGTAKPDEVWLCRDCHTQSLAWAPMCQRCQAFDTLDWLSPSPIGAFIAETPLGGPAPERRELGIATDS